MLAKLLRGSRLEGKVACNMVALVDGGPRQLGLKPLLQHWLDFRCGAAGGGRWTVCDVSDV